MAPTTGTIKRITDRGFGFIATPDGVEYFFHQSACTSTPFEELAQFRGQVNAFAGGGVEAKLLLRVRVRSTRNRLRRATLESQPEPKRNLRGPRARDTARRAIVC